MEFIVDGVRKPIITETDENGCEIVVSHRKRVGGYAHIEQHGKLRLAHKIIFEHLNGPVSDGLVVMHSCNVRDCVNPEHLSVGTQSENTQYAYDTNQRFNKYKCRATPKEVEDIRTVPETRQEKSEKHNMDPRQISRIIRGELYRVHAYVNCKRVLLPERARYHGVPEWYGKPAHWLKKYRGEVK